MELGKYSFGVGDRFAHQGKAQLAAMIMARNAGVEIIPVWNKSFREHQIIKTRPEDTRVEADAAVKQAGWTAPYFVDADHIGMKNIDLFLDSSDFFTLDVADFIGVKANDQSITHFINAHSSFLGALKIPGIEEPLMVTRDLLLDIAFKYLFAVQEAGRIYRTIAASKSPNSFVVEVSMDETENPQTPLELFFILSAIALEKIPVSTIAPKFTGRFNKGVDYVGNVDKFAREFDQDIAVVQKAITEFSLPVHLKLSVHSGSDKFSIYKPISKAIKRHDAGLHLKTAGTTWLEELTGLAAAGGEGLEIAKKVYQSAYLRFDELCKPYSTVIDINLALLPTPEKVNSWDSRVYVQTLQHEQQNEFYNLHFRQLLHVGYKVAAEMGDTFLNALKKYESTIARHVTANIFERHIQRIFM